jgi:hypothetical protein
MWTGQIIADNRERYVTRHPELGPHTTAQLTIGDFIITRGDGKSTHIAAIIERKEITDFAASLKDGRHGNKEKMLALGAQTHARVYYIVECPGKPRPTDYFGGIAFRNISAAIDHLQFRDNIHIIWTENTLDTAARLRILCDNLCTVDWAPGDAPDVVRAEIIGGTIEEIVAAVTTPIRKTDHEIAREMWACYRGISIISADEFIAKWSIREIVCGEIPAEFVLAHKTVIGRAIAKTTARSLLMRDPGTEIRILSKISRVSFDSAKELIARWPLAHLLSMGEAALAEVPLKKNKVGAARAAAIMRLVNYKGVNYRQPELAQTSENAE